jgi:cell division protein FtsQ
MMTRSNRSTTQTRMPIRPGVNGARSKRVKKGSKPLLGKKQSRSSRGMPPVLVRGGMAAPPMRLVNRSAVKSRRRYDVALSVPGAELRLPSIPQIRLGWRLLSGLLSLVLAGMIYYIYTSPMFEVGGLTVNGLQRLTEGDINSVAARTGEPIFLVNPGEIKYDLETAFPELISVSVQIGLPAEVVITVEERQPVLAWYEEGQEKWVDAEGVIFPPRGDPGPLVAVEGKLPLPPIDEEGVTEIKLPPVLVESIIKMGSRAPQDTRVVFHPGHGLGWYDWRGWDVYFGWDSDDIDMKLHVYEVLVSRLEQEGVYPGWISMEYLHAPYYRLER